MVKLKETGRLPSMINKLKSRPQYRRQKGLALVSVILIFAIATVIMTAMRNRQAIDVQRSTNLQLMQQARTYAMAIEDLAKTALKMDYDNTPDVDSLKEVSQLNIPSAPIGKSGYSISAKLIDAQSRFNLNNLQPDVSNPALQLARFKNLLNDLGLDPGIAERTSQFMDEKSQIDTTYMSLEKNPYRASYKPFKHTSELMLIEGVDLEAYYKLEPFISALPSTATLNINTASAKVIAALATSWNESNANEVISKRTDDGFATVDDFWNMPALEEFKNSGNGSDSDSDNNSNATNKWDKADFSVNSAYYEVFAEVAFEDTRVTVEYLIYRDPASGEMHTYYRDFSRRYARDASINQAPAATNGQNSDDESSSDNL